MCIHVYYGSLQQKRLCKWKNAGFYTWIMAISVSYFQNFQFFFKALYWLILYKAEI